MSTEREKQKVDEIMQKLSPRLKDTIAACVGDCDNAELREVFGVHTGAMRLALVNWRKSRGLAKVSKEQAFQKNYGNGGKNGRK